MVQLQSERAVQDLPRGRILLVDDDPGLLRLLSIRLRAERYDVEAVESAAEALAALSRFRPDLVISDLRMESMDGIALLKEIQRQRPGLCVLLLTAHGTIPDAVEATQSGAFGFLTKPVDKQQLLEYVERAMKVSGLPSTSQDQWSAEIITRSAAVEYAANGIRTNAVVPGPVGTPLFEAFPDDFQAGAEQFNPQGRRGTPHEIAAVVAFLLSSEASYVNGAAYSADGGELA